MSPYKNRNLERIKLIVFMKIYTPKQKKNRRKQEINCKKNENKKIIRQ